MSSYRKIKWKGIRGSTGGLFAPRSYREFFVDATNGNDADPGTSRAQAWETIGKVNGETFRPTDHILFKRGETWTEVLRPPSSGQAGKPIIFGTYGSGANPIIDAEDIRNRCMGIDSSKSWLVIDGIDCMRSTDRAIYFGGIYSDITVKNLALTDNGHDGLFLADSPTGRINVINVTSTGNVHSGVRINGAVGGIVVGCTLTGNGKHGLAIFACDGFTVENNEMGNNTDGSGVGGDAFTNCIIQDNEFYNNRFCGVDLTGVAAGDCEYNIVRRNIIYNHTTLQFVGAVQTWTPSTAGIYSRYNEVYNNLFYNNNDSIFISGRAQNNEFYHNTIYDAVFYGIFVGEQDGVEPIDNTIKNNTIQDSAAYHVKTTIDEATNVFDNNVYHDEHANCFAWNDIDYATFANWQINSGMDANSQLDNPDMVNPGAQDFHLQAGSPCRGQGGTGTGVTEDYDDVTRGDPPDIGAYEYVPPT